MGKSATESLPEPVMTESPAVWPLVIADTPAILALNDAPSWLVEQVVADMSARDALGRKRYGVPLQVENGRPCAVDAYQEILDFAAYARQCAERTRHAFWFEMASTAVKMAARVRYQMALEAELAEAAREEEGA